MQPAAPPRPTAPPRRLACKRQLPPRSRRTRPVRLRPTETEQRTAERTRRSLRTAAEPPPKRAPPEDAGSRLGSSGGAPHRGSAYSGRPVCPGAQSHKTFVSANRAKPGADRNETLGRSSLSRWAVGTRTERHGANSAAAYSLRRPSSGGLSPVNTV